MDYLGNTYKIQNIANAKITSSASPWDAGEPRNFKMEPEKAYHSITLTLKLDKKVKSDDRIKFLKEIPVWFVNKTHKPITIQDFGSKLKNNDLRLEINQFILSKFDSAIIDEKLSYFLLKDDGKSKVYSISAMIDRCKDRLSNWKKCKEGTINSPWWIYVGINTKDSLSIIELGGHSNAGFSQAKKNPEYKFFPLGDIIKMDMLNLYISRTIKWKETMSLQFMR